MKILKWFGNPYVFIVLYLLLIIEGSSFGSFYIHYLLLALPYGLSYSILSAVGIVLLILGKEIKWKHRQGIFIAGLLLMILALFVFFSTGNKQETFTLGIPLTTFIICGASGLAMISTRFLLISKEGIIKKRL